VQDVEVELQEVSSATPAAVAKRRAERRADGDIVAQR
jgi:hypothetical protein